MTCQLSESQGIVGALKSAGAVALEKVGGRMVMLAILVDEWRLPRRAALSENVYMLLTNILPHHALECGLEVNGSC